MTKLPSFWQAEIFSIAIYSWKVINPRFNGDNCGHVISIPFLEVSPMGVNAIRQGFMNEIVSTKHPQRFCQGSSPSPDTDVQKPPMVCTWSLDRPPLSLVLDS